MGALLNCWKGHFNLPVESSRPQKRAIETVCPVCGCEYNDRGIGLETIHFYEELIQRVISLFIATTEASSTLLANSINFVNEDDRRCLLSGLFKQITNSRSTNSDKHLDEFRPRCRQKWYSCLASHCLSQQSLTRTRRAGKQRSSRYACT